MPLPFVRRPARIIAWSAFMLMAFTGCASQTMPPIPLKQGAPNAAMRQIMRLLPSLARGHKDKTQLAFLADFKGLSPAADKFNSYMSRSQGKLLTELQSWAHRHKVSLDYRRRPGLFGKAQRIISSDEGGKLLHGNSANFQRLYLVMMYMDFAWQLAMDHAAEKAAGAAHAGPGLKNYLQNAIGVNTHSMRELWKLMRRYRLKNK